MKPRKTKIWSGGCSPWRTETCWCPGLWRSWSERRWGCTGGAVLSPRGETESKTAPLPSSLCGILTTIQSERHTEKISNSWRKEPSTAASWESDIVQEITGKKDSSRVQSLCKLNHTHYQESSYNLHMYSDVGVKHQTVNHREGKQWEEYDADVLTHRLGGAEAQQHCVLQTVPQVGLNLRQECVWMTGHRGHFIEAHIHLKAVHSPWTPLELQKQKHQSNMRE